MKKLIYCLLLLLIISSCNRNSSYSELYRNNDQTSELQDSHDIDINSYYLSLTTSYEDERGVLSEAYVVYDFVSNVAETKMTIEATSAYPCGVCDITDNVVYYIAAAPTYIGDKLVMLDNLYEKNIDSDSVRQLTYDGIYINKMLVVNDRIYFIAGQRSKTGVDFGYYDLNTKELFFSSENEESGVLATDISYHAGKNEYVLSWFSDVEQNALFNQFYEKQQQNIENVYASYADNYIDLVDGEGKLIENIVTVKGVDVYEASVSLDETTVFITGIREKEDTPIAALYRDDEWIEIKNINIGNAILSPCGNQIFYIDYIHAENSTVPHSILYCYDIESDETTEMYEFDTYVNNMVLLPK